ncbi:hypothetical protein ACX8Z9_00770 [Arthrobacter halodurans]|uniref:Uncharacterized protein n=1 Tax=Arthrobacter halodurans TaxID=516699 RepID=A0ABV4UI54_9MICC
MGNEVHDDGDAALKSHLHRAFDGQIPNYGSYNLVYAAGRAGAGGAFVVGFRRQPMEIVVAPLHPRTLAALEPAVAINLTNLSHLAEVRAGGHEVGTSTGRVFRFGVDGTPSVDAPAAVSTAAGGRVRLDQARDALDFRDFMDEFMTMLDGFDGGGPGSAGDGEPSGDGQRRG